MDDYDYYEEEYYEEYCNLCYDLFDICDCQFD